MLCEGECFAEWALTFTRGTRLPASRVVRSVGSARVRRACDSRGGTADASGTQQGGPGGRRPMVKKVGKYEIGRTLGEGTFGKVKYAVNSETAERVAIKILDKGRIQQQHMGEQIKKEIAVMKMVKQRHVVNLLEVLASRTKIFIVLELVTGGELFDKIVTAGRFDEDTARAYFRELISGVEHCHRQGVCHRDLKPENLLLDSDARLKISDFGLSALYGSDHNATLLHTTCGTPNYVAPEVLADQGYNGFAADVWSCAAILTLALALPLPLPLTLSPSPSPSPTPTPNPKP